MIGYSMHPLYLAKSLPPKPIWRTAPPHHYPVPAPPASASLPPESGSDGQAGGAGRAEREGPIWPRPFYSSPLRGTTG